jgi:hypothetical protein
MLQMVKGGDIADGQGHDRFNRAAVTTCIPAPPLLTRGVVR